MPKLIAGILVGLLFVACDNSPTGPEYTVYYNINGGNGITPNLQTVKAGQSVILASGSNLTRTNFTFSGWNTNTSGTGANYSAGSSFTPSSSIHLFARWIHDTYTITYNINGGSGTTPNSQPVNVGSSTTLRAGSGFTKTDSIFDGWNTNSSGTGTNYVPGFSFTPSNDTTLYAKWIPVGGVDGGTLTYGGQSYNTVIIGGKRWMAENLNFITSNSWCYQINPDHCAVYGRLYTWDAAISVCPSSWRLPTRDDWNDLVSITGNNAGTKLKSKAGWDSGGNGTDVFGFSALPGGLYNGNATIVFANMTFRGYWWSNTESGGTRAWQQTIDFSRDDVQEINGFKDYGYSVRCLEE